MLLKLLLILVALPAWGQEEEEAIYLARHMYRHDCASCHGDKGEGNDELLVPAIAGLPDYYVMQQMEKFRALLRGGDPESMKSQSMHQDAKELDDATLKALARVINAMTPVKGVGSVIGDRERGQMLYENLCAACHGQMAQGDASKESPPLHGFQDWYIVQQVQLFKAGKRKADPANVDSVEMHAMAKRLWRGKDVRDIASFIATSLEGYQDAEP